MTRRLCALFLCSFLMLAGLATAQSTGSISGTVTDPNGASVAGARVTVAAPDGRTVSDLTTGADGSFSTLLTPGHYIVTVSQSGFDPRRMEVDVRGGDTRTLSMALRVAGLREQVSVIGSGPVTTQAATATKGDAPLVETPASISVVSSTQIQSQGVTTVPQSLRYTAAILPESRGAMTALDYMYSRGFLVNQYQDGLKLLSGGYSLPQLDPYLLESVELLRGPASVLYGQADPGGVLNLVSKRPTATPVRDVQFQFGNYDRVSAAFDIGGRVGSSDSLRYRIAGSGHASHTQVDHARDQRLSLAPSLAWTPHEGTRVTVSGVYQQDPAVGFYNWIPAYGTVLPNPVSPGTTLPTSLDTGEPNFDKYARTFGSAEFQLEHRLSTTWTIRENVRQAHVSSVFDKVYSSYLADDGRTLNRYAWHLRDGLNAFTTDTQAQAALNTGALTHTVLTGVDYQRGGYTQDLGYNFSSGSAPGQIPALDILAPVYGAQIATPTFDSLGAQTSHQVGLYAQDRVAAGPWRLLLGGRHDWTGDRTRDRSTDDVADQSAKAFTGRAGVVYVNDAGFAPYASVSQSFQPTSGTDFEGNAFKPTTGQQYEGGVKYQQTDARASVALAAFQLTQQNVLSADPIHPRESVQTGELRSRGVELSVQAAMSDALSLTAALSHSNTIVTKAGISFGPGPGKTPSGLPADLASAWIDYKLAGSRAAGLGIAGGVRFLGSSWGDDDNDFKIKAATLIDTAFSYAFGAPRAAGTEWRAALNVSNLFDKTYVASCGGADYCAYGFRRTLLATLKHRW